LLLFAFFAISNRLHSRRTRDCVCRRQSEKNGLL
jgi:hypothetical protein